MFISGLKQTYLRGKIFNYKIIVVFWLSAVRLYSIAPYFVVLTLSSFYNIDFINSLPHFVVYNVKNADIRLTTMGFLFYYLFWYSNRNYQPSMPVFPEIIVSVLKSLPKKTKEIAIKQREVIVQRTGSYQLTDNHLNWNVLLKAKELNAFIWLMTNNFV